MTMENGDTESIEIFLDFVKAPKEAKERQKFYDKINSLLDENIKEFNNFKINKKKRRKEIILSKDDYSFFVSFYDKTTLKFRVSEPDKNFKLANVFVNKIVNFLNIILGEYSKEAKLRCIKMDIIKTKQHNLAQKIIGNIRIAKINEEIKQTIKPVACTFEISKNDREFYFSHFSQGANLHVIMSSYDYNDILPFDFFLIEYDEINKISKLLDEIIELEM